MLRLSRAVLTAVVVTLFSPALAHAKAPCGPVGARTLASGQLTRAFVSKGRAQVCTRGSEPIPLFKPAGFHFVIAGRWAGYMSKWSMGVVDARTGGTPVSDLGRGALRLTARGGAAVQQSAAVVQSAGCGEQTLTETADAGSLKSVGSTVRWTEGGTPRRAPVCPTGALSRKHCAMRPDSYVEGINAWGSVVLFYDNDEGSRTYLCRDGSRKLLASSDEVEVTGTGIGSVGVAGEWISWAHGFCWKECWDDYAAAINTRTGERRELSYGTRTRQMQITPSGVLIALFGDYDSLGTLGPDRILARTRDHELVLDEGSLTELRVVGNTAFWRSSGTERSATLPEN